jgi:hypothetical protein
VGAAEMHQSAETDGRFVEKKKGNCCVKREEVTVDFFWLCRRRLSEWLSLEVSASSFMSAEMEGGGGNVREGIFESKIERAKLENVIIVSEEHI